MSRAFGAESAPERWREQALNAMLTIAATLGVLVTVGVISNFGSQMALSGSLSLAVLSCTWIGLFFARSLGYRLRATVFLATNFLVLSFMITRVAFLPGIWVGLSMTVVLTGVLLGRLAAVLSFVGSLATISGAGYGFSTGQFPAPALFASDPLLTSNWVRIASSYTLLTLFGLISVTYIVLRIEDSLLRSQALVAQLNAEIASREEAEAARRQAEAQLFRAQKAETIGQLAGSLAHDFNNSLAVITGGASILGIMLSDDERATARLSQIKNAAMGAAEMTSKLMDFSRLKERRVEAHDLNTLLKTVAESVRLLLPRRISVTLEHAPDLPKAWLDADLFSQMVLNLAANARDAMPNGGELKLRTASSPRSRLVCLEVQDEGVGMDEALQARIFETFFTTKPPGQGTGLGLAMVHRVLEEAGGAIEVESQPNQGTLFRLHLPTRPD
jgi:signal transduction histidine kinase